MQKKRSFQRPVIVISRCIEHDPVRYNGDMISSPEVAAMKPYVSFIPVCPEVEIGLGIPRSSIRIVRTSAGDRLIQPATDRDLTEMMDDFSQTFIQSLPPVDGFILKNKSPTSGIANVNVYPSGGKSRAIEKGPGFFGKRILQAFSDYPIEDEGRIRNLRIREHFLTRVFMLADFRQVESGGTMSALVKFHSENKLLLMAYSQAGLATLGRIVANAPHYPPHTIIPEYRRALLKATRLPPRYTSHINVLLHSFGYISDHLSSEEKRFFLEQVEAYRSGRLPLPAVRIIIQTWLLIYPVAYLKNQTWFAPYPDGLVSLPAEELQRGREMYEQS
ncbi:DUF523 and DUF1722 domain-containing protein [Methanospirillum sp.]|uniref:YbgA family protein n=2 Tax=Methanospirillum sp. TaxID=45200 RepID=UPI002B7E3AE4|nr:DUF523 and DUF1722 domain-containing protein [Methanospirillum sp.]HOL40435.1 DUF523 and DUF1722 domain-containing protein [Methanospirillum sp.]HPP78647.1 DUF523 and DUF1722 domain-containing protein [Methanospirillum sp.]